jgi:hypothetical protein
MEGLISRDAFLTPRLPYALKPDNALLISPLRLEAGRQVWGEVAANASLRLARVDESQGHRTCEPERREGP